MPVRYAIDPSEIRNSDYYKNLGATYTLASFLNEYTRVGGFVTVVDVGEEWAIGVQTGDVLINRIPVRFLHPIRVPYSLHVRELLHQVNNTLVNDENTPVTVNPAEILTLVMKNLLFYTTEPEFVKIGLWSQSDPHTFSETVMVITPHGGGDYALETHKRMADTKGQLRVQSHTFYFTIDGLPALTFSNKDIDSVVCVAVKF